VAKFRESPREKLVLVSFRIEQSLDDFVGQKAEKFRVRKSELLRLCLRQGVDEELRTIGDDVVRFVRWWRER